MITNKKQRSIKGRGFFLLLIVSLLFNTEVFSQTITKTFFGQNAWMPDTIGNASNCNEPPCILSGQLHKKWGDIKTSGAGIIRFGGMAPDRNRPTNYQYIKMIDSVRARGMEPIIQVPFHNYRYTAAQAAEIVKYINVTKGKNIKYWIIANEPDLEYSYTSASQIAPYFKAWATAMKQVDPTILTIGPELSWYNPTIMNPLTTPGGPNDITGKDANGNYYADIISFHTYPFNGTQSRSSVITKLTSAGSFQDDLTELNSRLSNCDAYHGRTGTKTLKTAVTEANINFKNPDTDNAFGVGGNSFIGGQFWAEMMGIGMKKGMSFINFWSTVEGSSTASSLGYIDKSTGKKPTYYHFKMLADNFRGRYANGTDNQANVKAFGSTDGTLVAVMLMNQDQSSDFAYTVRLNNDVVSGSNALKVNIDANLAKEYSGTLTKESSMVLIFDASGNIKKKIEYKLRGNADAGLAPTETNITAPTLTASISPAGTSTICPGTTKILSANQTSGTYQWKKDGVSISGATGTSYTATATGSYSVTITSGGSSTTSAPAQVNVTTPTATISAGGSTTFNSGGSVILNAATASGNSYQWKKDGVNITGAISTSYTANASGNYTVTVTNASCSTTSAAITVKVNTVAVTASITPSGSTTVCTGSNVVLKANTGTGYTYAWKKDGVNISGATASSYTATTSGNYTVTVSANGTAATSAATTVTVTNADAVILNGATGSFPSGGSLVLNAKAVTGYVYQWKKNGADIAGATAATYTATTAGSFQLKVSLGTCADWSAPIVVTTAATALTATITPASLTTIIAGGSVVLNANKGTGYTYQWKLNGVNISGATADNYSATKAGSYAVTINSSGKTVTSANVSVIVNVFKAVITAASPTTIPSGGKVVLNANTGSTYTYQWKKNGVNITGATSASYTATTAGDYQLKINYGTLVDWSAPVKVTIGTSVRIGQEDSVKTEIAKVKQDIFEVKIGPNPSISEFNLNIKSSGEEEIKVRIFDTTGRLCLDLKSSEKNPTISFGSELSAGHYITEITQGSKRNVTKLIKVE